jgi:hypothetical protein
MTRYYLKNGERVAFTAEEEAARDAEEAEQATKAAEEAKVFYQKQRTGEADTTKNIYPQIGDQLDLLFHAIEADTDLKTKFADFYNAIKAVKDAYPKP